MDDIRYPSVVFEQFYYYYTLRTEVMILNIKVKHTHNKTIYV